MSLSESDKSIIREIVRDGLSEARRGPRYLGTEALVGEKGGSETEYIPTRMKAQEIADASAKDAIETYKKNLPKWYQVHKRLDSASALVVVLLALAGVAYEVAMEDQGGVRGIVHWAAGTETRVRKVLNAEKGNWKNDQDFRSATGDAFKRWAESEPAKSNPMRDIVQKTLEASPVLVFQGQSTFFLADRINEDCVSLNLQVLSALTIPSLLDAESPPALDVAETELDPSRIPNACGNNLAVYIDAPLDVPFFARVYDTKADGPADTVFAILVVTRAPKDDAEENLVRTGGNNGPAGLCVSYTTQNPLFKVNGERRESLDLVQSMIESGEGSDFWQVSISDAISPHLQTRPPSFHLEQILHSVNVRPITDPTDLLGYEECEGVTPVDDQIISVRVLVFVNKEVNAG